MKSAFALALSFCVVLCASASAQDYLSPVPMVPAAARKAAPSPAHQAKPAARPAPVAAPAAAKPIQQAAVQSPSKPDLAEDDGDWRLECFSAAAGQCHLFQRRVDPSTQSLLVWAEVTRAGTEQKLTVMTPLGLRAQPALALQSGGRIVASVPLVTCLPAGCVHAAPLTPDLLKVLQEARDLSAVVTRLDGQSVGLQLSMRGFVEANIRLAMFFKTRG